MEAPKWQVIGVIALALVSGQAWGEYSTEPNSVLEVSEFIGYVEDEFIVVFKEDAPEVSFGFSGLSSVVTGREDFDELGAAFGVNRIKKQFPEAGKGVLVTDERERLSRYHKIRFENGNLEQAMDAYRRHPFVETVEPIGIHTVYLEANDPFYRDSPDPEFPYEQWHYWASAGIDANQAWDIESGEDEVVVAVLDSGVRYFHVDIGGPNSLWGPDNPATNGNIWINPGEIADNGIDDDLNGYVDDTIGWDFVSSAGGAGVKCLDQDCGGVDNDPDDGDGHGTHVAGTISAITNNGRSVSGVAGGFSNGLTSDAGNGVKVMALRIGYHARYQGIITGVVRMDWAAEAMTYVADKMDSNNVNIAAINCSWGSSNSGGMNAAVNNLLAHDVMIIHAAGNSNSSSADFLGGKSGVMNVAATDIDAEGASFTNHGTWVDLAAPGVDILSTYANPDDPDLAHHYIAVLSGTSMAAPHACGVAALLESFDCSLSGVEKFDIMVSTTNAYSDARDLGSGILNAINALQAVSPLEDLNEDTLFDVNDVNVMSEQWLLIGSCIIGDINGDKIVNFLDFAFFANSF
ncbi:MAG: S8 family serine peptidase [Planctomycetota bacterium]|jgi:subtilisin family serine protease